MGEPARLSIAALDQAWISMFATCDTLPGGAGQLEARIA
jgi:hypothetical protein